jgi:hypothetical protein
MGSAGIAAWFAHIGFWILVSYGWLSGELSLRGVVVFVVLWLAGLFGLPYLPYGAAVVSSYIAVIDIALVFVIFKGDVRLS